MSEQSYSALDACVPVTRHLEVLKRSGVKLVLRYLNPLGPSEKEATESEARAIAAASLQLGLVSEGWGDFAHGGVSAAAGQRDADHALVRAPLLGAPDGAGIYFAVDCDASEQQISKLVLPYFASIASVLRPRFRVGVYGSGLVCSRVLSARLADLAWLSASMGWRESREFLVSGAWQLAQKLPARVGHFDFDPDDVRGDCGSFTPFASANAPPPPTADPLEALVAQISGVLARGKEAVQGAASTASSAAHSVEDELAKMLKGVST